MNAHVSYLYFLTKIAEIMTYFKCSKNPNLYKSVKFVSICYQTCQTDFFLKFRIG